MKTTSKDSWRTSVLHQFNKLHSISRWGVWVCPLWGHLRGEATPLDGAKRDLDASLVRIICCLFDDYCHKISIYRLNLTFLNKNLTLDHDTTLLHMMNIDFILLLLFRIMWHYTQWMIAKWHACMHAKWWSCVIPWLPLHDLKKS